jgi:hypothetical protein
MVDVNSEAPTSAATPPPTILNPPRPKAEAASGGIRIETKRTESNRSLDSLDKSASSRLGTHLSAASKRIHCRHQLESVGRLWQVVYQPLWQEELGGEMLTEILPLPVLSAAARPEVGVLQQDVVA